MTITLAWIFAILFGLTPAIFWLVLWYRKDKQQPEPKRMVLYAFFLGMLGIIPFLGIEHMLHFSPSLLSLWDIIEKRSFFLATVILAFVLAALEEFVKHFSALKLGKRLDIYFDEIVDGIVYSVSAALGFAFMENVIYFVDAIFLYGIEENFWTIYMFRSFGTMLAHTIFSGVFGYFWGYAMFSRKICAKHTESVSGIFLVFHGVKRFVNTISFHIIRTHVLRNRPSKRKHEKADLVREAFLLATILHLIFNLLVMSGLFGRNLTPLIAPVLVGGFLWLSQKFFSIKTLKIWKPV